MKSFIKYTLATVVGIFLTLSFLFLIGVVSLVALSAGGNKPVEPASHSVFHLKLEGALAERTQENPLSLLSDLMGGSVEAYGLDDVLASIAEAKDNPRIEGIYLDMSYVDASYASLQAVRRALVDFKTSGKFIVAYADRYLQKLYYLASVADRVVMNPQGMLEWKGLSASPLFYKKLMDNLGVEMQIFKVGTYKSAVEPYMTTQMSDANREQVSVFLQSIWGQLLQDISASRGLSVDSLQQAADRLLMLHPASETVQTGLVDTLMYRNDMRDYLKHWAQCDADDKLPLATMEQLALLHRQRTASSSDDQIAVYYAEGSIVDALPPGGMERAIIGNAVIADLRKLAENDDVKAVVLRVNSPGGSAFASEQIYQAVKQLKAVKPVIVSMGDYAASGGYYISAMADTIVAEATTLTGSIGIFGMVPNLKGLADRVGLAQDVVKTNKHADFGTSILRPFSEDEKTLMQMTIAEGYETFLARCAEGRNTTPEAIHQVAEGRVWTGQTAQTLGLVDVLGGLDTALRLAAQKAGLDSYQVKNYPAKSGFLESLLGVVQSQQIAAPWRQGELGRWYRSVEWLQHLESQNPIQARLPFELDIR